jgi:hypothetical protein
LLFLERFDDDTSAFNDNSSVPQNRMPVDEIIATSGLPMDFETAALKIMMSRYFRGRTRFKMAVRFVISQV